MVCGREHEREVTSETRHSLQVRCITHHTWPSAPYLRPCELHPENAFEASE